MSRTRAVLTALLLTSTLTLAGCSDDPEPKFAPSTPATSSTLSTAPTSAASPADTVEAWIAAQNGALASGDTSTLENLAADGCRTCAQFEKPIRDVFDHGGYFHGGSWTLDGAKVRKSSSATPVVQVAVTVAAGETQATADSDPVTYASQKHIMVFKLVKRGNGYAITFIGFAS